VNMNSCVIGNLQVCTSDVRNNGDTHKVMATKEPKTKARVVSSQ
jgi:hypothetical protein